MAQSLGLCMELQSEDSILEELSPVTGGCGKGSVTSPGPLTPAGNDTMVR